MYINFEGTLPMKEEIVQGIVPFLSCSFKDKENLFFAGMRGQFHQPIGTKHKFAVQFHHQNFAQLYQET